MSSRVYGRLLTLFALFSLMSLSFVGTDAAFLPGEMGSSNSEYQWALPYWRLQQPGALQFVKRHRIRLQNRRQPIRLGKRGPKSGIIPIQIRFGKRDTTRNPIRLGRRSVYDLLEYY